MTLFIHDHKTLASFTQHERDRIDNGCLFGNRKHIAGHKVTGSHFTASQVCSYQSSSKRLEYIGPRNWTDPGNQITICDDSNGVLLLVKNNDSLYVGTEHLLQNIGEIIIEVD